MLEDKRPPTGQTTLLAAMGGTYPSMPPYQSYLEKTDGLMVREVYYENGEFDEWPTLVARVHLDDDTLTSAVFTREYHVNVLTLRGDVRLLKGALKVIGQKTPQPLERGGTSRRTLQQRIWK